MHTSYSTPPEFLYPAPQRAAGTAGTYPGSFLAFDAASAKFALVWEQQPSNNANRAAVHLQQYDGAKWTTVLKTTVKQLPDHPVWPLITTPQLRVSVAPSRRAVVTLTHMPPSAGKKATTVTHTWNGTNWTQQANATFTQEEADRYANWQLQALNSGSALLAMGTDMWRLA